mgnify:CR=1 FL=1
MISLEIETKYLVLKLSVQLCIEAYHSEEEPGQFLYAAMQFLEQRLGDVQETESLTAEEQIILGRRESDLREVMAKTRQELGYTPRS